MGPMSADDILPFNDGSITPLSIANSNPPPDVNGFDCIAANPARYVYPPNSVAVPSSFVSSNAVVGAPVEVPGVYTGMTQATPGRQAPLGHESIDPRLRATSAQRLPQSSHSAFLSAPRSSTTQGDSHTPATYSLGTDPNAYYYGFDTGAGSSASAANIASGGMDPNAYHYDVGTGAGSFVSGNMWNSRPSTSSVPEHLTGAGSSASAASIIDGGMGPNAYYHVVGTDAGSFPSAADIIGRDMWNSRPSTSSVPEHLTGASIRARMVDNTDGDLGTIGAAGNNHDFGTYPYPINAGTVRLTA
ncbi:hypothetical protein F4819DRAFT_471335 [Hypoxylon fuscum]|nr:hypothetical protein F4819DRAFT_471335 [Hypoxylon fuscum]